MSRHLDEMFADFPTHLSIDQLAALLGVARGTAYKWLNDGRIPGYKVAGTWVILRDEVKDSIANGRNAPGEEPDEP